MEKVKLTKEQADAVNDVHEAYLFNIDAILTDHAECDIDWEGNLTPLNTLSISTLATALINGYEVEQTPEEKLREYYDDMAELRDKAETDGTYTLASACAGKRMGVRYVLDTLGIKVEGINADKTEGDD